VLFTKALFTGNIMSAKSGNPKLLLKSSSIMNMGGTLNKSQRLMLAMVLNVECVTIDNTTWRIPLRTDQQPQVGIVNNETKSFDKNM